MRRARRLLSANEHWRHDVQMGPHKDAYDKATGRSFFGTDEHFQEERLNKSHFLLVHDALKKFLPSCDVKAHISDRLNPFQAHMTVLVNGEWKGQEDDFAQFAHGCQSSAVSIIFEPIAVFHKIAVHFPDFGLMALTVGQKDMTIAALETMEEESDREIHRGAFGCDIQRFENSLGTITIESVQQLQNWIAKSVGPSAQPPPLYWQAHCYHCLRTRRHLSKISEVPDLYNLVKDEFSIHIDNKLCNPLLPDEDLNTLGRVKALHSVLSVNGAPRWDGKLYPM